MQTNQKFNIRVYGILLVNDCILVSDEHLWGKSLTKFPGGGLEWGEGIIDCLKREFKEELNLEINVEKLFYINDFFQLSQINKDHQIISIYYIVSSKNANEIVTKKNAHDHPVFEHGSQVFRWLELKCVSSDDFHFPIDKIVASHLQKLY